MIYMLICGGILIGAHDWMHSNAFHFDDNESVVMFLIDIYRGLVKYHILRRCDLGRYWYASEYNTGDDNICTEIGNSFQHNVQLLDDGIIVF